MTPAGPMSKEGFVYILASKPNGTLYVGVTNDIVRRIHEHRTGEGSDVVEEYDVTRLVHLERFDDIQAAIRREKRLKDWKRELTPGPQSDVARSVRGGLSHVRPKIERHRTSGRRDDP